jgi:hypothetical protein
LTPENLRKYYQWKSPFIIYLFSFHFSPLCTVP